MFESKVVIVTGSSSGIGARAAVRFAKEGAAAVVLTGRRAELLEKVKQECESAGKGKTKVKVVVGDITDAKVHDEIINGTVKEFGRLDILVNNAGTGFKVQSVSTAPIDAFDNVFNVNVRSVVQLTQLAIPHLIKSKGNIVNVSSIAATKANAPFAYYCMSKAALDHYSRCLAVELGPQGVRVNVIRPGAIPDTDFVRSLGIADDSWKERIKMVYADTALRRGGTSEEIADNIIFLASDQASFITGSIITADGGRL